MSTAATNLWSARTGQHAARLLVSSGAVVDDKELTVRRQAVKTAMPMMQGAVRLVANMQTIKVTGVLASGHCSLNMRLAFRVLTQIW